MASISNEEKYPSENDDDYNGKLLVHSNFILINIVKMNMQKALAIQIQETAYSLRNQQKILLDTLKKLGTGKSNFDFENKFEDYNKNLGGEAMEQKQLQLKESRVNIFFIFFHLK